MECFIKKIFEENIDKSVHLQFQKFSRGEFKDKALAKIIKAKNNYRINTTYEYANEFVKTLAEKLPEEEKVEVKGVIVSTKNLKEIPEFYKLVGEVEIKQFMGVKQFKINKKLSKRDILEICEKFPASFIALSFSVNNTELKIKAKSPKSAKPRLKGKNTPKSDFCKIKTSDLDIVKGILFDIDDFGWNFKKIKISHDFIINEIILPKGEKNPEKMRVLAKRKGRIVRKIEIDGKTITKEKEFVA